MFSHNNSSESQPTLDRQTYRSGYIRGYDWGCGGYAGRILSIHCRRAHEPARGYNLAHRAYSRGWIDGFFMGVLSK